NEMRRTDEEVRQHYVYVVCDGVGGADAGEIASLHAVEGIHQYFENGGESIEEAAFAGNRSVCEEMARREGTRMGSTYAALYVEASGLMKKLKATACNVGDSRVYMFRGGNVTQLTKDHSRVQQLIDAGMMTVDEARISKMRHVVTQHLGTDETEYRMSPFVSGGIKIKAGDIYLVCSDGLTDMMTDETIEAILNNMKNENCEVIADALVNAALNAGGRDNVTVVIVKAE
ncbi:MAG: protein phosphatase 2C domain-containing protein, partial [Bacillota bacterium]|nr:protein phosphatase 2C domain-containing protein [Bacillota bacterium]